MKSKFFTYLKWLMPLCYACSFAPLALHSFENSAAHHPKQELKEMVAEKTATSEIQNEIPVQAELITPQTSIQPGKSFWVGIHLHMAKDWATYWKNPGDSGAPTNIQWQLPKGFEAGPVQWPIPEKHSTAGLIGYGYSNEVTLLSQITPPKDLSLNTQVEIGADVSWVACKESCIPGKVHLTMNLPATLEATPMNSSVEEQFVLAEKQLPKILTVDQAHLSATQQGNQITLNFDPTGGSSNIKSATFYSEIQDFISGQGGGNWKKVDQGYALTLAQSDGATLASHLKGLLLITDKSDNVQAVQINVPLNGHSTGPGASQEAAHHKGVDGVSSLAIAMGLAFVGGLILNMMPCVLPVIALKIFGFVKIAQQRRSAIFKHGAVYALGVLVSFWLLSGALLILRAYGAGIGWGFQLQEPLFVISLVIVLFLLGLSLFGVFELGASLISLGQKSSKPSSPVASSFFSGVLATLVATPCTGPLLGPALGFAMTLSPFSALVVFTCMGLGMAAPYLLFSGFPKLIRFLPKPGNWMITFKQVMGFMMMATVIWLIWVFGAQTSIAAVLGLLVALLIISVGAWIFGHWGTPARKRIVRTFGMLLASCTLIGGVGIAVYSAKQFADEPIAISHQENAGDLQGWQAYSPEKVDQLRAEGKPVFVDFTAKWCLICQANKVILHSSDVDKAFNQAHVVTMIADWTKNDQAITQELQKFGRSGVPLYVLYPADPEKAPYILPQTLTSTIVSDYLQKLEPAHTITADAN